MAESSILQAIDVVKNYGNYRALEQVSIDVPEGKIYGLLGPNGAGKTTLIRIINQITAPDSGQIKYQGRNIVRDDISSIGYLPEERGLYKKMKVGEQALYLARLKGMSEKEALFQIKEWFVKFEIQSWWDKKVEELSKGMQQKLQFITTVLHKPKLLIFDEPFSGFDPINASMLKNEILELKKQGTTIIFSTHNMASVEELCDHFSLIHQSKVLLQGKVFEVRNSFKKGLFEFQYYGNNIEFDQTVNQFVEILDTFSNDNLHTCHLRLIKSEMLNDLIRSIIDKFHLVSYREILPSMNEIFIQTVNNQQRN